MTRETKTQTQSEVEAEEVDIVECPGCGKQAGIAEPRCGGIRAVCNDCETDMLPLTFFSDEDDERPAEDAMQTTSDGHDYFVGHETREVTVEADPICGNSVTDDHFDGEPNKLFVAQKMLTDGGLCTNSPTYVVHGRGGYDLVVCGHHKEKGVHEWIHWCRHRDVDRDELGIPTVSEADITVEQAGDSDGC